MKHNLARQPGHHRNPRLYYRYLRPNQTRRRNNQRFFRHNRRSRRHANGSPEYKRSHNSPPPNTNQTIPRYTDRLLSVTKCLHHYQTSQASHVQRRRRNMNRARRNRHLMRNQYRNRTRVRRKRTSRGPQRDIKSRHHKFRTLHRTVNIPNNRRTSQRHRRRYGSHASPHNLRNISNHNRP